MRVVTDPAFVEPVRNWYLRSPYPRHVDRIRAAFPSYEFHLFGGMVRNALIEHRWGVIHPPSDLDIALDDSAERFDVDAFIAAYRTRTTSYGAPLIEIAKGVKIDLVPFSRSTMLLNGDETEVSAASFLRSKDMNVGAGLFDLQRSVILDGGMLDAIERKEIDIQYDCRDPLEAIAKVLYRAHVLGFHVGERTARYIETHAQYLPAIEDHLVMRGKMDRIPAVQEQLRRVRAQALSV